MAAESVNWRRLRAQASWDAYSLVHQNGGKPYSDDLNPFTDQRQRHIFERRYDYYRERYFGSDAKAEP